MRTAKSGKYPVRTTSPEHLCPFRTRGQPSADVTVPGSCCRAATKACKGRARGFTSCSTLPSGATASCAWSFSRRSSASARCEADRMHALIEYVSRSHAFTQRLRCSNASVMNARSSGVREDSEEGAGCARGENDGKRDLGGRESTERNRKYDD
eukprot:5364910-Pleurochrysis_carterae.AAC.2